MLIDRLKSYWKSQNLFFRAITLFIIIILVLVIFILPLKLPYSFNAPGKIFASEEWIIMKGRDAQLITLLKDNRTGISKSYSVTEFERGDNTKFIFNPKILPGSFVSKSDTIGSILSNELELRLASLKGQLAVTSALLNQSLAGEKESLVQEARDNLELSKQRMDLDEKIFIRQQGLFEKGFISEAEFDISKNILESDQIAVKVAEAQLQTVLTGEKTEQIESVKTQMLAIKNQIDVLEKRSVSFNLVSPLSGYVRNPIVGDTLMIISETDSYVLTIPVPLAKRSYISEKTKVFIYDPISRNEFEGRIETISNSIEYISTNPVFFTSVVIEEKANNLVPGIMLECRFDCGNIAVSEHLRRIFNSELF
jgi:hypothetical protein